MSTPNNESGGMVRRPAKSKNENKSPDFNGKGEYYKQIAAYFDEDARDFEQRYNINPVLKKMRRDFIEITEGYDFTKALEIGCGPGLDIVRFAGRYPGRTFDAIDISPGMTRILENRIREENIENASVATGSVEDVRRLFPGERFDMVYVYFGGLNTVYDLKQAAKEIRDFTTPDTTLVLTFVNRFYLPDVILWLAKGKFRRAFDRLLNRWKGYSEHRPIPSRACSSADIRRAFTEDFRIIQKKGYCIFYPAWYRSHLLRRLPQNGEWLWRLDELINKTPFWNTGEYTLYVLKKSDLQNS